MNKKLIDKYGFKQSELDGYCCFKVINGNLIEYNEGLQELKDCIAEMGEEKHRTWERLAALEGKTNSLLDVFKTTIEVPFKIMQDAVQSQNDAIEANKKEAHRANDRLTMVLRRLKVLGVWKDEEVDKQASEMQAEEKKAFEVGDPVVLSCKCFSFLTKEYIDKKVFKVGSILDGCHALLKDGSWFRAEKTEKILYFNHDQLEHAPAESPKEPSITEVLENVLYWDTCPEEYKDIIKKHLKEDKERPKEKALEFGDWAETLVGKVNIPKGSKVLITLHLDLDNDFYCSTGQSDSHFEYYKPEELKPL